METQNLHLVVNFTLQGGKPKSKCILSVRKQEVCSLASNRCVRHLISPEGLEEKHFWW